MLDSLDRGSNQQDLLARIHAARNPDSQEQTDEQQASQDDIAEETQELPEQELNGSDSEELETAEIEASEADDEAEESYFVEIDGEEIDLNDIKKWKDGHLMQSDYTRKTQELADQRKTLEAEQSELQAQSQKVSELTKQLEAALSVDDGIDWAELREDDPAEYLRLKEQKDARQKLLDDAKSLNTVDQQKEQQKLIDNNPQWLKDGQPTKAYQDDMKALESYYNDLGWTQDEVNQVNMSSKYAQAVIDAARYKAGLNKTDVAAKKLKKAPVVTKPKSGSAKAPETQRIEKAQSRLKQSGSINDAFALLKAKRGN